MLDRPRSPWPYDLLPKVDTFNVTSKDVQEGKTLADTHTFEQGNESPELTWTDFPERTKSFAVTCFDPDAPTASGWWHWVVANIPVTTTSLPHHAGRDETPGGGQGFRNDFGVKTYGGAAPPPGDYPHRYIFAVHALDVETIDAPADASAAMIAFNLTFHTIARATVTPVYQIAS